ncbi:MAG TPA: S-methyl-5'-thioadenosine phosphorylase [Thermoanaerobaculia bacterium]|nr:S-methyl-5'-thioadenosine phosphorylase [Thermoanaerobaculia bacterium]HQR67786.1 S-methyl-5'-thioadenosine phosphorylase [Thermoanaerobaculia bacterium]
MTEPGERRGRIGLIGGSGLYALPGLSTTSEVRLETPFGDPSDAYLVGELSGVPVAFLARHGRQHRILPSEINYRANVWGFRALGCDALISASACGSMKEAYRPTDLVLPDQFIDRTHRRGASFFGGGCVAHVSLAHPVCPHLLETLDRTARERGARVHTGGTYLGIEGPQFSTRAESFLYRSWGVDVIGMTNVVEARLCREAEICYATMALVTDYDCWHEEEQAVTVEAILEVLRRNAGTANAILAEAVARIDAARRCACREALRFAVLTRREDVPEATRRRLSLLMERYWA